MPSSSPMAATLSLEGGSGLRIWAQIDEFSETRLSVADANRLH
jgi:hypothetical protein